MRVTCGSRLSRESNRRRSFVWSEERSAENTHLLAGNNDIRSFTNLRNSRRQCGAGILCSK